MIHEKADTVTDIIEPILFCTITARKFWGQSKPEEINKLQTILNNTVYKKQKYNMNDAIDKVIAETALIQSVLFN